MKGISSYAPLLPGHGTSPERLAVIRDYQWIEAVNESIDFLLKDYHEIYIVGSSFGGNLAILSSNHSTKIKGIVTVATPIIFRRHKISKYLFLPLLKRIKLFQRKPKRVRDFIDTHNGSYKVIPLRSAYEMSKIVEKSKNGLSKVVKPIFVVSVENDSVISDKSHRYILDNVSSRKKRQFIVKESNHVALLGDYAEELNREILKFVK
jgi:carboxylesterase